VQYSEYFKTKLDDVGNQFKTVATCIAGGKAFIISRIVGCIGPRTVLG
jgi:hypothetical protein